MERRVYEPIKHKFTPDEVREMGEALARESAVLIDLKDRKANAAAAFQAEQKAVNVRIAEYTIKINQGFEVRETECMYDFDNPRMGMKSLVRCDDPEQVVRIESMTLEEQQQSFNFHKEEEK